MLRNKTIPTIFLKMIEEAEEEDDVEIYMKRLNQQAFFKAAPEPKIEKMLLDKKVYELERFNFQITTKMDR